MEGKLDYKGKGHFIIIGWSKNAKKTIYELLEAKNARRDVVLIGRLPEAPIEHERFHYISGNPTEVEVLKRANIDKADSVSVFASEDEDDVLTDGKTLLVASAIEKYAMEQKVQVYTVVEIVHERHIGMFQHAHVDEFVLSSDAFPHLMAKTLLHHGASQLFMQLLSDSYGENLWEIKPDPAWETYGDAYESLKRQGANLIAEGQDFGIIRKLDASVPESARLYIICDSETFNNIVNS